MLSEQAEIDALLLKCVERGLDHFGSSFKFVVYDELKKKEHLEGTLIVHKPVTFAETLERVFGAGTVAIRRAIVQEIAAKFHLSTEQEDMVSMIQRVRNSSFLGKNL